MAAMVGAPLNAQTSCGTNAGFRLPDGDSTRQVQRIGGVLAFTSGLRVNTDGAANSYHPVGRSAGALNTICNGIAVTPASGPWAGKRITAKSPAALTGKQRCQMILDIFRDSRDRGYAVPPTGTIDWYAIAMRAPIAGKYRPCIQQSGRYAGFFVAQTAQAADLGRDDCDPAKWISSTEVPYITLPGQRLAPHGVRKGDLALVHRRSAGRDMLVVAVAGDSGNPNELGEASLALHRALGNTASRGPIPGNIAGGVTTFVFPGLRASRPITPVALQAELDRLTQALGGMVVVRICTAG